MLRHVLAIGAMLAVGSGAASAQAADPALQNVLSAVSLDLNDDGTMDRAVLWQTQDSDATLYIYLSDSKSTADPIPLTLAFKKTEAAFAGGLAGQEPSLEVNAKGALVIRSTNSAIGRSHWDQALTIVYRDATFMVAGVTYTVNDTLDPKAGGSCDINLLSGKGTRNGAPVHETFAPIKLADWSDDKLPKACQF